MKEHPLPLGKRFWRGLLCLLVACGALGSGSVRAADVTITARFDGNTDTEFENTTPTVGFCADFPQYCPGFKSVLMPLTYSKATVHSAADVRDRFYIRLPASRKVTVVNYWGGQTHELPLTLMFNVIGQEVEAWSGPSPAIGLNPGGGCSPLSAELSEGDGYKTVRYAWAIKNPATPQGCSADSGVGSPGDRQVSDVREMTIGYRLLLPNPYRMRHGLYRGSTTFYVGSGGDFDLGNGVSNLSSNTLTLHFELDVRHAFDVNFPPGSDRAVLEPPGGWQAWLGGRGKPPRLQRDLPFTLWSTGPFSIFKRCQRESAGRCGIRNGNGDEVPVSVKVSLPPGVTANDAPVRRITIPSGVATPLRLELTNPVASGGKLHFEVDQAGVDQMLTGHAGTTYNGEVTIVFDSEL